MNVNIHFDLVLYGMILAGLGVLAHRLAPDFGYATLITGIAGGSASVFWGVLGLRGFRRRIWPISTLLVVAVLLLMQAVRAWLQIKRGDETFKPVAVILTVLLAFGIGQLVNLAKATDRAE
ncbi:MAG: hypothetical protein IH623_10670 [Verrucomicrobia bacterium]|nr:hypothetical protein [Verrucomicrobiota bacterium]